jgi:uncharacterized protein (DUF302 family)
LESKVEVHHICQQVNTDFQSFTQKLEQSLGRFDPSLFQHLQNSPRLVEERLQASAGEEGLMLFDILDHGKLLNLVGAPRKARQYIVGNPLIALTMTRHDIRAGLYAPLRIFVYEAGDQATRIEYDLPSSLFGQFRNLEVTAVARTLDRKLSNLIRKAGRPAASH